MIQDIIPQIVNIADACLGGLQGRSALLIGPEDRRYPYSRLLQRAGMKHIYQEATPTRIPLLLPYVQLLISIPALSQNERMPLLTAASIAQGCDGRYTPLLIFDLAGTTSVEELAGLLPPVCLYTPEDMRSMLAKSRAKAS